MQFLQDTRQISTADPKVCFQFAGNNPTPSVAPTFYSDNLHTKDTIREQADIPTRVLSDTEGRLFFSLLLSPTTIPNSTSGMGLLAPTQDGVGVSLLGLSQVRLVFPQQDPVRVLTDLASPLVLVLRREEL
jgi:hypothetical protein